MPARQKAIPKKTFCRFVTCAGNAKTPRTKLNSMNRRSNLEIIELRNYLLKPGTRQRFVDYFENHFIDSQNVLGGYVLGQFRIKGEDDKFFWIRGFEDMKSRLAFLRAFYQAGEVWRKFGSEANDMMLDSDNVYLLRPLPEGKDSTKESEGICSDVFTKLKEVVVVDFYLALDNQLNQLVDFFRKDYVPFLKGSAILDVTLWTSEPSVNDFPRLPVIKDENLLVAISSFEDEPDYQAKTKHVDAAVELKSRMQNLIRKRHSLILFRATKSLQGVASLK
jgi:hypothetical protein